MGLSARVTRVVGQIGARRLTHGARSVSETVPARAAVGRSAARFPLFDIGRSGPRCPVLLPVVIRRAVSGRRRLRTCAGAPWNVRLWRPRPAWSSVQCDRWQTTGRRPAQIDSQESARPLRRHVRPVLKHGPRSLTCERAIEIVESQTRNESEVSSDGTSGDPSSLVAAAHPRATPSAGLLFTEHC